MGVNARRDFIYLPRCAHSLLRLSGYYCHDESEVNTWPLLGFHEFMPSTCEWLRLVPKPGLASEAERALAQRWKGGEANNLGRSTLLGVCR